MKYLLLKALWVLIFAALTYILTFGFEWWPTGMLVYCVFYTMILAPVTFKE